MKHKKYLSFLCSVLLGVFSFTSLAHAQPLYANDETTGTEREHKGTSTVRGMMQEKREEIKTRVDSMREKAEERKMQLEEKAKRRIAAMAKEVAHRFNNAVERLKDLEARIQSRITKLTAKGFDLHEAQTKLDAAHTLIVKASDDVAGLPAKIDALFATATSTRGLREGWGGLKTIFDTAKEDLKAAHAALVEAIKAIKRSGGVSGEHNASSTKDSRETEESH